MDFNEGCFKAILEKYINPIMKRLVDVPKDVWEKFKVDFDLVFIKYIKNTYDKYSKIKTILYRTEPKYIYDFFEAPTLEKGHKSIETADIDDILDVSHFLIIQGTGGIGKSTLLKHFFINELEKKDLIPIFLELKDINDLSKEYKILDIILEKLNNLGSSLDKTYMEYALKSGCFLFLLDGYDEINTEQKDSFLKKLDAFCDKYSSNYYIISSRPCSEFIEFQRFTVLSTKALSKAQAKSLIRKLDFDSEIKTRFISALEDELYERHKSFASNPLLLNIMLMTFDNYAEIPEKLHLFYSNAFETLYSKHDATKAGYKREMRCKLSYDTFRKVFSYFCFISYNQGKVKFSCDDLRTLLVKSSSTSKISFDIDAYIYDLENSLCVLYREGFEYIFAHRSFQEYFAAVFLKELPDDLMKKMGIQMLTKDSCRVTTDSVFSMLYDMSEDRFEQNLLLPVLDEYEKECAQPNKYDFYLERAVYGISFMKRKNGEVGLWRHIDAQPSKILFIDESTSQYITRTKGAKRASEEEIQASQKLYDYFTENYDYAMNNTIKTSILINDQIAYELLKETWLGRRISTMASLSETLRSNQEVMRLDMFNLID